MFFQTNTFALVVVLLVIVGGSSVAGTVIGRRLRSRPGSTHESVGVVQGTLLGLVGLLLAFGLPMAVGRFEARRELVVQESNDIGTTYLRVQMLGEPARSTSLELLRTTSTPPSISPIRSRTRIRSSPTQPGSRTCSASCGPSLATQSASIPSARHHVSTSNR